MGRLQAMTTFVRVVEMGSFSAAARQLGVGQPAVSKTVAQLEQRLQVRSTHALAPTDAGLRFYERARHALQEVDEAELEARGAGAGLPGRLRVSAATTFARLMIVPHLREFMACHPSLDIDVVLDDRVIDLVSEGIDIALRLGTLADSAVARKIASGGPSVVATPPIWHVQERRSCPPISHTITQWFTASLVITGFLGRVARKCPSPCVVGCGSARRRDSAPQCLPTWGWRWRRTGCSSLSSRAERCSACCHSGSSHRSTFGPSSQRDVW